MSSVQALLEEFQLEASKTRRTLERVPEERFGWKPHRKSWTMAQLASHIAEIPSWVAAMLQVDEMDLEGEFAYQPFLAENRQELLRKFDQSVDEARRMLASASEEKLSRIWRIRAGEKVLFEAPRLQAIKSTLINHAIQHRGQLTVYLRLNDVPVPALYGPSADEPGH